MPNDKIGIAPFVISVVHGKNHCHYRKW